MSSIIHKVFNKAKSEENREITLPISGNNSLMSSSLPTENIQTLGWTFGSGQSVGRMRDHNEDAIFSQATIISSQGKPIFMGLFIVADGMGGHANGELASRLAVRAVAEKMHQNYLQPSQFDDQPINQNAIQKVLLDAVLSANQVVKKQVAGGGTTLTALLIIGDQYVTVHVGDSRLYFLGSDHTIKALTHDHSYVQQLVDIGYLTQAEAELHPQRNILSMALGQLEPLVPEVEGDIIPPSGYFILCSDGLWGVIKESDIIQAVISGNIPSAICKNLIDLANQAGGPDNISVILIQIPEQI